MIILNNEIFCKGMRNNNPQIIEIAEELGVSVSEVFVRWSLSKGYAVALPPTAAAVLNTSTTSLQFLPEDIMKRLENLEEGLGTSFVPIETDMEEE